MDGAAGAFSTLALHFRIKSRPELLKLKNSCWHSALDLSTDKRFASGSKADWYPRSGGVLISVFEAWLAQIYGISGLFYLPSIQMLARVGYHLFAQYVPNVSQNIRTCCLRYVDFLSRVD